MRRNEQRVDFAQPIWYTQSMIRRMLPTDTDAICRMMRVFYQSAAVLSNGSEEIFQNDIQNCIGDSPYLEGYVYDLDGDVVAYTMLAKSFSTEFGKPCIWIEDIYVEERYRGQGIGRRLLEFVTALYPDHLFRLEAEADNHNAIRLYQKCGFEILPYLELKK